MLKYTFNLNTYLAVGAMLLGIVLIDSYGIIIKSLGDFYSTTQLLVFRNVFAIIPLIILILFSQDNSKIFKDLNKKFITVCLIRGLCFTGVNVFFFISVINMQYAIAMTLTFASPFFIALLSIFILKDKVGIYRWSAIVIGFFGVVMIMKPTSDVFVIYSIFPILVAFCWSLSMIVLKFIPENISTAKIQFYSLFFSIVGAIILYFISSDHQPIENIFHLFLMVMTGILGGTGGILFIYAYRLMLPSKLAPFEYLGIPSSFILGWVFFKEAPIDQLFPGVLAIVLAGMIIIWRDAKKENLQRDNKKFY
jgi:drug/metabolite transporter (DMT)-like permease